MKKELFIETLNLITSWLAVQKWPKTTFISSILDLLNAIKIQRANIFHLSKVKILQAQQDMPVWLRTWEKSNRGVMTSKLSDTLFYISYVVPFLGKIYRVKIKMKNIKILRKRSWRHLLMSYAEDTLLNLKNIWNTAVVLNLNRIPITNTAWVCSKSVWRDIH